MSLSALLDRVAVHRRKTERGKAAVKKFQRRALEVREVIVSP